MLDVISSITIPGETHKRTKTRERELRERRERATVVTRELGRSIHSPERAPGSSRTPFKCRTVISWVDAATGRINRVVCPIYHDDNDRREARERAETRVLSNTPCKGVVNDNGCDACSSNIVYFRSEEIKDVNAFIFTSISAVL